jgi:flagellar biosynthesis GTPase FlhF
MKLVDDMAKDTDDRDIPRSVTLVAIIALALLAALVAATLHAAITGNRDVIDSYSILSSQDIWVMGILAGIFTVIFLAIFIGLLLLRGWGRAMVMIFGLPGVVIYLFKSIMLISSIVQQIMDNVEVSSSDFMSLASSIGLIAVSLFSVWYLSRPNVILVFEAEEVELTKRRIGAIDRKIQWGRQKCNAGEMSKAELAKLKAECLAKEKVLRGRIRHLDKVRLGRERKQKEAEDRAVERWEEKQAKKKEKKAAKEEKKAEKESEKEEKGEKEEEAEEGATEKKDSAQENHAENKNRKK